VATGSIFRCKLPKRSGRDSHQAACAKTSPPRWRLAQFSAWWDGNVGLNYRNLIATGGRLPYTGTLLSGSPTPDCHSLQARYLGYRLPAAASTSRLGQDASARDSSSALSICGGAQLRSRDRDFARGNHASPYKQTLTAPEAHAASSLGRPPVGGLPAGLSLNARPGNRQRPRARRATGQFASQLKSKHSAASWPVLPCPWPSFTTRHRHSVALPPGVTGQPYLTKLSGSGRKSRHDQWSHRQARYRRALRSTIPPARSGGTSEAGARHFTLQLQDRGGISAAKGVRPHRDSVRLGSSRPLCFRASTGSTDHSGIGRLVGATLSISTSVPGL